MEPCPVELARKHLAARACHALLPGAQRAQPVSLQTPTATAYSALPCLKAVPTAIRMSALVVRVAIGF